MREIGEVIGKKNGKAYIRVGRSGRCEDCVCEAGATPDGEERECSADNSLVLVAEDPFDVEAGMQVEVELQSAKMISTVLLVFWLPLVLAGLGYWMGYEASRFVSGLPAEALGAFGSVLGLVTAIIVIIKKEKKTAASKRACVILRVI